MWLQSQRPELVPAERLRQQRWQQFYALINTAKLRLHELYTKPGIATSKQQQKTKLFERLESDYQELKRTQWQGDPRYDGWFSVPVNNARLAAFSTYRQKLPELYKHLGSCGGDIRRFMLSLQRIMKQRKPTNDLGQCAETLSKSS